MIKMAPSMMCANFGHLADTLQALEQGGADMLHFDIMDGHFVPNFTMGPKILRDLRPLTSLPFDVHLSVEQPERFLDMFAAAGANSVAVHVESSTVLFGTIDEIHKKKMLATAALSPATPLEHVRYLLSEVDRVMLLSVDPGFSGQRYVPAVRDKVTELRSWIEKSGLQVEIQVGGHVSVETAGELIGAGADILVLGTASIFRPGDDPGARLREFKAFCNSQASKA